MVGSKCSLQHGNRGNALARSRVIGACAQVVLGKDGARTGKLRAGTQAIPSMSRAASVSRFRSAMMLGARRSYPGHPADINNYGTIDPANLAILQVGERVCSQRRPPRLGASGSTPAASRASVRVFALIAVRVTAFAKQC